MGKTQYCLKTDSKADESKSFRLLGLCVMLGEMFGPEDAIKRWNDQVSIAGPWDTEEEK